MSVRYKYFIGLPHQKVHALFVHNILGGDFVSFECDYRQESFPETVFEHDGPDVVWFFNDVYLNLHPKLKGKQILLGHGLGFGRYMKQTRTDCINRYFAAVFATGVVDEDIRIEAGVKRELIHQIGYPYLFLIPKKEVKPKTVLFSSTYFGHWEHYGVLRRIIQKFPADYEGYLTIHPQTPDDLKGKLVEAVQKKQNVTLIKTQQELLDAIGFCAVAVAGLSSVTAPFWFLKRPVIYLRGPLFFKWGKGFGWGRIKKKINHPLFEEVLRESSKLFCARGFHPQLLASCTHSRSASKVFYSWNDDEEVVKNKIREAVAFVERERSS